MWTTLNFEGRSKTKKKKRTGDICKGILNIKFEQDWSVRLVPTLGDGQKIKNCFSSFRVFLGGGKADSAILLGFECTINPEYLIKIVGAIFEKMKILHVFLMWTTLNFESRSKIKKKLLEIFVRGP